ncbi:hypothetical protein TWF718_010531 [Orbilia javanica]|uniref:Uncharacterized protein n=1 Tax=Orbilia javanica TaxID=47235 RepID=A0AAN8MPD8_9PEZI
MGHESFGTRLLLPLLLFFKFNNAEELILLPREGDTLIRGWEGLSYQAIRYEPLCGNLGTADYYRQVYSYSPFCQPATEEFTNATDSSFAVYDSTGILLRGSEARIGNGKPKCSCFALRQIQDANFAAAICMYVNGDAQMLFSNVVGLNYRPGVDVDRALPLCGGFDIEAAKEQWSKTAVQPQATGVGTSAGDIETQTSGPTVSRAVTETLTVPSTEYTVSTYFPSVMPYTETAIYTTTGSDGVLTTITTARTTLLPVVTVSTTPESGSKNDKVVLGVGLGIGIPALILLTVGTVIGIALLRRRTNGIGKQASEEPGVAA